MTFHGRETTEKLSKVIGGSQLPINNEKLFMMPRHALQRTFSVNYGKVVVNGNNRTYAIRCFIRQKFLHINN